MAMTCTSLYAFNLGVSPEGVGEDHGQHFAQPATHILATMDQSRRYGNDLKRADEGQNLLNDEEARDRSMWHADSKLHHQGYKSTGRFLVFVLPWVLSLVLFSLLLHAHWVRSQCASPWGRLELGKQDVSPGHFLKTFINEPHTTGPATREITLDHKEVKFVNGLDYDDQGDLVILRDPQQYKYVGPPDDDVDSAWDDLLLGECCTIIRTAAGSLSFNSSDRYFPQPRRSSGDAL